MKIDPISDGEIKLIFTPSSTLCEKGSKNGVINGESKIGNPKIETNANAIKINFIYKFEYVNPMKSVTRFEPQRWNICPNMKSPKSLIILWKTTQNKKTFMVWFWIFPIAITAKRAKIKITKGEKEKIKKTFSAESQTESFDDVALSKSILSISNGIVSWFVNEINAVADNDTYNTNKNEKINSIELLIVSLK